MLQRTVEGMIGVSLTSETDLNLVRAVDGAALCNKPFDHIYMDNVFPGDLYREILENLPAAEQLSSAVCPLRAAGRRDQHAAAYVSLSRKSLAPATRAAQGLEQGRRGTLFPGTRGLIQAKIPGGARRSLSAGSREHCAVPRAHSGARSSRLSHRHSFRHADQGHHGPVLSAQRHSQAHLGTIFHATKQKDGTDQPVAMQFLPASGYAFPVRGQESWHSAAKTSEADGERRSIMLTYYGWMNI